MLSFRNVFVLLEGGKVVRVVVMSAPPSDKGRWMLVDLPGWQSALYEGVVDP